jgi:alpha-1,6-mannosyltransferase
MRLRARNNAHIGAALPTTGTRTGADAPSRPAAAPLAGVPERALRATAALGLAAVLASAFLLAAGAAGAPNRFVPARSGGWPGWLAGPLAGLHIGLPGDRFQTLSLVMCAGYLLVLAGARTLSLRILAGAILAAHVALALGPPLISQDVFGYEAFARMGALHGLDPYTHIPSEAPTDPVFPFLGWPFLHSPYGPLFTLASYAVAPLGLAAGLWVLKALTAAASLAAVALIALAAGRMGGSRRWTAAFVGLNPVLLSLAVAGAHNDTLLLLALALALLLTAGAAPRYRAAAVSVAAAVGVKVSAALLLPFLALAPSRPRERLGVVGTAALSLAVVGLVGLVGFGANAFGFLDAVGEQQQLVATHSIPAETARLVGLAGTPAWWRHLFLAAFAVVLVVALWRTARGADWRVAAGWSTLALLLATAWLLPWYAVWLLPLAAVGRDRRLCAATLLFCGYAVLIHLSLADGLLNPRPTHVPHHLPFPVPGVTHRLELTGFQVLHDVQRDLGW